MKKLFGRTPNKTVLIKIFRLREHNSIETPQSTYFASLRTPPAHINSTLENLDLFFYRHNPFVRRLSGKRQNLRNAFEFNADKLNIPLRHTKVRIGRHKILLQKTKPGKDGGRGNEKIVTENLVRLKIYYAQCDASSKADSHYTLSC